METAKKTSAYPVCATLLGQQNFYLILADGIGFI